MSPPTWRAWFYAARPKTLTAAFVPILVGTALAYRLTGHCRIELSFISLVCTLFIQIGTNFINDSYDFARGADTHERLGPERASQSGWLSPARVKAGGLLCFLFATFCALPLVVVGGWPILVIGIMSLISGFLYTGGPFPLAYLGFGDLFVLIFFGWVAVGGIYYLNTEAWNGYVILAGTQVGFFATVLIAINNFRDFETDRIVHKRTLAVRLGPFFSRMEIALLILGGFSLGALWLPAGCGGAFFTPLFLLPMGSLLIRNVFKTSPGKLYNRFLAQAAALHLAFGISLAGSLIFL